MGSKELQRAKWARIESGEESDDYQNPFLSHFGFMDYPLTPDQERVRRKLKQLHGYE